MTTLWHIPVRVAKAWNGFFHGPLDLRVCALLRIAYASLVLIWLAVLYPDLATWFSEDGVIPLIVARKAMPGGAWTLLALLPQGNFWLTAAWVTAFVQTLLLLFGLGSRMNAASVFVWVVSFAHRNVLILDGEDTVFRLIGFYLILMPCGACWSVDAWIGSRGRFSICPGQVANLPHGPAWGLRLVQIQMCVIFVSAALCKLQSPAWRNGTAMYYIARLDDYFGRFPTPDVLWQTPWIVGLITWGTIAAELAIPLAIWWPPARRWALAAALAFHLANEYTMHLFLFHWIMLVGWASFLNGDDLERVRRLFAGRPAARTD
jgi:vitamin K-dependent gamma-carboxylase-like protein